MKMPEREQALPIANEIVEIIAPHSKQVMICGSIRREKPFVKDIEIVYEPIVYKNQGDLFGDEKGVDRSMVLDRLNELVDAGELEQARDENGSARWGLKYQKAVYKRFRIDLFAVTPPAQWGVIVAIRTGPADYSRWLVCPNRWGGAMPNSMKVNSGRLLRIGLFEKIEAELEIPTEKAFFEAIGEPYVEPCDRQAPQEWLDQPWQRKYHGQ